MFVHEAAKFEYIKWSDTFKKEKPYQILSGLAKSSTISNTNITFEQSEVEEKVTDIRQNHDAYSLDSNGFNVHTISSDFADWSNQAKVESEYIPQVIEPFLRKHVEDVSQVVVFDWHVRHIVISV